MSEETIEGISIDLDEIGAFLAEARSKAGLTLRGAEEGIGISRVTLCNYEKGNRTPSAAKLAEVLRFYGYEVTYFLVRVDDAG